VLRSLLVFALGCTTPTQVVVHFTADPGAAARARTLRVVVLNGDLEEVSDRTEAFGAALPPLDSAPAQITIVPESRDAARQYRVVAMLADDAGEFSRVVATAGFVEDQLREIWLHFDDACSDRLACAEDQTCSRGECAESCVALSAPGTTRRSEPAPCDRCFGKAQGRECTIAGTAGRCWDGACCVGCWDGTSCAAGSEVAACGRGGVECAHCSCDGDACSATTGACAPAVELSTVHAGSRPERLGRAWARGRSPRSPRARSCSRARACSPASRSAAAKRRLPSRR
jgi:hypothetical protein